jgi:hypothetical protein
MKRDDQHDYNADRILKEAYEAIGAADKLINLETGWHEWSASIQGVDEKNMKLLRAAFEAGFEAAWRS